MAQDLKEFMAKLKEKDIDIDLNEYLKDEHYYDNNMLICTDDKSIEKLKKSLGDAISYSTATVYGYSKDIPIYVKNKEGKVFMLHEHPERKCDWEERKEKIDVAFVTIPQLRLQGLNDEEIEEIKKHFKSEIPNPTVREKSSNKKVNMSPIQVGSKMEDYFQI